MKLIDDEVREFPKERVYAQVASKVNGKVWIKFMVVVRFCVFDEIDNKVLSEISNEITG